MRKLFLFIVVIILGLSAFLNLYFLQDATRVSALKEKIKTITHRTEMEKSLKANPEVLAFFKNKKFTSKTAELDYIRHWIFENTFGTGDTNYIDSFDPKITLHDIYQSYIKKSNSPPMSCGPRALAMQELLYMLGFETRFVSIFFQNDPNMIGSHSFLEIYNEDTKRWEIQDPLNDVYYIDSAGNRLNTLQITMKEKLDFLPCRDSLNCGVKVLPYNFIELTESFKIVSIKPKEGDFIVLLNSKYYTKEKVYPIDGTTLEGYFKNYKNIIVY